MILIFMWPYRKEENGGNLFWDLWFLSRMDENNLMDEKITT